MSSHARALSLLATLLLLPTLAAQQAARVERTYAIRNDGRIVGYQIETETKQQLDGREVVRLSARMLMKLELLGQPFEQALDYEWILDAADRRVLRLRGQLEAGPQVLRATGDLRDDGFHLEGRPEPLDPSTVVISPHFRWVAERGPKTVGESIRFDYLVPEMGDVVTGKLTYRGEGKVPVLGEQTVVREYELQLSPPGTVMKIFLDDDLVPVRTEIPLMNLLVDLATPAMVERIERVDFTSSIIGKTNLEIDDPSSLTFMKVRATLERSATVTVASLNLPGQRFEGTVEDGRVEGVFTIEPRRFDGAGAMAFPVPEGVCADPDLQRYLEPQSDIQSDDPEVVRQARGLAGGARDSFEVLDRLARWTDQNIDYVIPGGGSAALTLELRKGECGGHSRVLAAMLRSLGIPARTPMGGMYVPLYGGSFGQHMWTEAWLGKDVGWVSVDCTASQATFIDAGHIRLGEGLTSFGPLSLEVLDHAPKVDAPQVAPRRSDGFPWQIGEVQTFVYTVAGKSLGSETMVYAGRDERGHRFEGVTELADGRFRETSETIVGDDGGVRTFHAERQAGAEYAFDVALTAAKATVRADGPEGKRSNDVDVEPDAFVMHNNNTAHFAIVLQRALPKDEGGQARVQVLHVEQRSPLRMTLTRRGQETITVAGKRVLATKVDAELVGLTITLHVDDKGRLLRFRQEQGDVTIEIE